MSASDSKLPSMKVHFTNTSKSVESNLMKVSPCGSLCQMVAFKFEGCRLKPETVLRLWVQPSGDGSVWCTLLLKVLHRNMTTDYSVQAALFVSHCLIPHVLFISYSSHT